MNKAQLLAIVCVAIGLYSFLQGKKGMDTASLINTWAPLGAAAYYFFV